ncbi:hypothetical protein RHGRI_000064 [Rhododendron griersonianum]|uniref:Uncharacterized protein n=1 Tax=Rhododendron griersonianum TaxID=479676 RepID=A0AAV6LHF6_9ERIC|nr:hypothetical protein RHGRI_000064 [Rhododendron griersonianum]
MCHGSGKTGPRSYRGTGTAMSSTVEHTTTLADQTAINVARQRTTIVMFMVEAWWPQPAVVSRDGKPVTGFALS